MQNKYCRMKRRSGELIVFLSEQTRGAAGWNDFWSVAPPLPSPPDPIARLKRCATCWRRLIRPFHHPVPNPRPQVGDGFNEVNQMKLSDNPRIPGTCTERAECGASFFCGLPEEAALELRSIKVGHTYLRGSTLFLEGQTADGVYLLCSGRVKLTTYSEGGKAIILR